MLATAASVSVSVRGAAAVGLSCATDGNVSVLLTGAAAVGLSCATVGDSVSGTDKASIADSGGSGINLSCAVDGAGVCVWWQQRFDRRQRRVVCDGR